MVIAVLLRSGYSVSIPFGGSQKYDLILDRVDGSLLERVQVKTGRLNSGSVVFQTVARNTINGRRSSYFGLADTLMVYCPETERVYRVPITPEMNGSTMALRVDAGDTRAIKRTWAKDYEFPPA